MQPVAEELLTVSQINEVIKVPQGGTVKVIADDGEHVTKDAFGYAMEELRMLSPKSERFCARVFDEEGIEVARYVTPRPSSTWYKRAHDRSQARKARQLSTIQRLAHRARQQKSS